jgi:hypothetical protein
MPPVKMPDGVVVMMPDQIDPQTAARLKSFLANGPMPKNPDDVPPSPFDSDIPPLTTPKHAKPKEPGLFRKAGGALEAALGIPGSAIGAFAGTMTALANQTKDSPPGTWTKNFEYGYGAAPFTPKTKLGREYSQDIRNSPMLPQG